MNIIIDWGKVYDIAKSSPTKEEFLKVSETFTKIDESAPIQKFIGYMEQYQKKVLPSLLQSSQMNLTPEKFVNIVVNAVKKDSKLLNAFIVNPQSMFASILFGAEIGLVPSDEVGELFLIPRNMKQDNGQYKLTITPLIGYKGLVKIIMRGDIYEKIEAQVVYKGDKFKVSLGTNPKLDHVPKYDVERTADSITHAYAVIHFKSGQTQFAVVTRQEIMAVWEKPKEKNRLYFNDKESPNRWMEKKCALIQLSKTIDKDFYGAKAIEMDAAMEGGAILTLDHNDQIKLIEGASVKPARFRNIYGTLNQLPNSQ
jgi:phage RecT family recombinase